MGKKIILYLFLSVNFGICNNDYRKSEYEISLPEGWIEVSKETADFLIAEENFPSKTPAYEKYDYLYELKSNDTLFTFPYILIQINNSERLTKRELKNYGSKYFKYDAATNYLWKYGDSTLEVIIPTEKGTINIFCYSSKEKFQNSKEEFKDIVNSIFINPKIKYSSNFILEIPILKEIIYSFNKLNLFFLAVIIFLLSARRIKHKKAA
ncbi:MAG TPA: hypothetical protein VMT35_12550 [Ignavibacteriaceae bacterium]|nr:hypothetical protein [Ignavibacteriaceae bacterium]